MPLKGSSTPGQARLRTDDMTDPRSTPYTLHLLSTKVSPRHPSSRPSRSSLHHRGTCSRPIIMTLLLPTRDTPLFATYHAPRNRGVDLVPGAGSSQSQGIQTIKLQGKPATLCCDTKTMSEIESPVCRQATSSSHSCNRSNPSCKVTTQIYLSTS